MNSRGGVGTQQHRSRRGPQGACRGKHTSALHTGTVGACWSRDRLISSLQSTASLLLKLSHPRACIGPRTTAVTLSSLESLNGSAA